MKKKSFTMGEGRLLSNGANDISRVHLITLSFGVAVGPTVGRRLIYFPIHISIFSKGHYLLCDCWFSLRSAQDQMVKGNDYLIGWGNFMVIERKRTSDEKTNGGVDNLQRMMWHIFDQVNGFRRYLKICPHLHTKLFSGGPRHSQQFRRLSVDY